MPNDITTFGGRLRDAREEIGLNQSDLAGRLGVAQSVVSRLEGGGWTNPDLLRKIAAALDVSLDWLIDGRGRGPARRPVATEAHRAA